MGIIIELLPRDVGNCNAVHIEVDVSECDDYTVIHSAKLCFNKWQEVNLDLSILENQDLAKEAVAKKCYMPMFEWELEHEI